MKLNSINYIEIEDQLTIVGRVLASEMASAGVKKAALAEIAQVSANTVNNCISGKNSNLKTLLGLLYAMGIDVSKFFSKVAQDAKFPHVPVLSSAPDEEQLNTSNITKEVKETGQTPEQIASRIAISPQRVKVATNS